VKRQRCPRGPTGSEARVRKGSQRSAPGAREARTGSAATTLSERGEGPRAPSLLACESLPAPALEPSRQYGPPVRSRVTTRKSARVAVRPAAARRLAMRLRRCEPRPRAAERVRARVPGGASQAIRGRCARATGASRIRRTGPSVRAVQDAPGADRCEPSRTRAPEPARAFRRRIR
jgi:hypothetical protein